jgi:hypothetical protein
VLHDQPGKTSQRAALSGARLIDAHDDLVVGS